MPVLAAVERRPVLEVIMVTVYVRRRFVSSREQVWGVMGDFWALDRWHPAVPNCHRDSEVTRRIELPGVSAVETLLPAECGAFRHVYVVEESPMPLRDYRGRVEVHEVEGEGCLLEYEGTFEPAPGVPEKVTEKLLTRFFESGFEAVARELCER